MMMSHFDLPVRNRKDLARAAQLRSLALARPVLPSTPYGNNTYLPSNRRATRPSRNIMTSNLNNTTNPYYLNALLNPYLTPDQTSSTELHLLNTLSPKSYYRPTSSPSPYHNHNNDNSSSLDPNHPSSSISSSSSSSYPRRSLHSPPKHPPHLPTPPPLFPKSRPRPLSRPLKHPPPSRTPREQFRRRNAVSALRGREGAGVALEGEGGVLWVAGGE